MTNEEAIKYIKANYPDSQRYEGLCEALDMATEALEKQIPKKPIVDERYVKCICPKCWAFLTDYQSFCDNCGQKLRWDND